jgi:hypothetical protein
MSTGEETLVLHLRAYPNLPAPIREYHFVEGRNHRFDFAWPEVWSSITQSIRKLAVEIEGEQHRTRGRYRADLEKYNLATALGWSLLRFRPAQVTSGMAVDAIRAVLTHDDEAILDVLQRKE